MVQICVLSQNLRQSGLQILLEFAAELRDAEQDLGNANRL
jgi:hypothetical protein